MITGKYARIGVALPISALSLSLVLVGLSGQRASLVQMELSIWQMALTTVGTSLLAGVLSAGFVTYWRSRSSFVMQENRSNVIGSNVHVFILLALLGSMPPIILALFWSDLLGLYLHELLVSSVVVVSATCTFRILTHRSSWFRQLVLSIEAAGDALRIRHKAARQLKEARAALNQAAEALEVNAISQNQAREIAQTVSLVKWMQEDDLIGWYELREEANFGKGLTPQVRSVLEHELIRARQNVEKRRRLGKNGQYEERIEALLSAN